MPPTATSRALVISLFCLAVSLLGTVAGARPFDVIGGDWEGCADFVRLARDDLGDERVKATQRLDLRALRPIDSVVVLHPEKTLDVGSFARFMKDGGRVILFDDYGTGDTLLEHFSLRRIAGPENPVRTLLDNPQLAIAEPDGAHPVVTGVTQVVLNHATGIRHNDLSSLLIVRTAGAGGGTTNIAVAGMVGRGRFLAVGDPSIVMNRMLRYPGNRAFARGVLAYAADQDTWGKRDGFVYVVSGGFEQKGAYGEDSAVAAEWSERLRFVSDAIQSMRREGMPPVVTYSFCVLLGLAIVLWVGANAARVHKPLTPRFTRPIPLLAQGGIAGHVAVLAAPGTSRALALLELKSALEERLSGILDLERIPSSDVLLNELTARRLVGPSEVSEVRLLFARMAHIETMVLSRRANALANVPDSEVLRAAEIVRRVTERAEAHKRAGMVEIAGSAPGAAVP